MSPTDPLEFLRFLALKGGGRIVSSNDLSPLEIATAQACGRMLVTEDGLGFVWLPPVAESADVEKLRAIGIRTDELERLRAELGELASVTSGTLPDGPSAWAIWDPFTGLEFFDTRQDAEEPLLETFENELADTGEGIEESGYLFYVVGHVAEDAGATAADDSEAGESLRERGHDYEITGYVIAPGSGINRLGPLAPPAEEGT